MKTRHYKTLHGLLRMASGNRVTLYDIMANRANIKGFGWTNIALSDSLKSEIYDLFGSVIYANKAKAKECAERLQYVRPCGILDRLYINKTGAHYCAGQDYVGEIRFIQGLVRKA